MLPTIIAPLAIYKTFASGALLVGSFLYLPQGFYGALAQMLSRFTRGAAAAKARVTKSQVAS
jgi:branched-chain amino acid transport system permease protein